MDGGNLRYQFARLGIAEKLIAINLGVYLLNALLPYLLNWSRNSIENWFSLPREIMPFLSQPWSLFTYGFFHDGFLHLLFNMLFLYFFGRLFLNYLGPRKFLNVFFLGIMAGGIMYMAAYNIFPVFSNISSRLIGASAGVSAILIFVCSYVPNQQVRLFFFNVKLWQIGAFFVLYDLVMISMGDNPGGRFAHLGGALLGYLYARQLVKGNDIGKGFETLGDSLANLFKKREKKAPLKTVYRSNKQKKVDYDKANHQRKIDSILDKISKSGYESLTQAEKDFLFKAGKED